MNIIHMSELLNLIIDVLGEDHEIVVNMKQDPSIDMSDAIMRGLMSAISGFANAQITIMELNNKLMKSFQIMFIIIQNRMKAESDEYQIEKKKRGERLDSMESMIHDIHTHIFYSPPAVTTNPKLPEVVQPLDNITVGSKIPKPAGFAEKYEENIVGPTGHGC